MNFINNSPIRRENRVKKIINDANPTDSLDKFSQAYKVNRAKAYEGVEIIA